MKKGVICFVMGFLSMSAFSDEVAMNKTLLQIISQINATLPLIEKAKKEQGSGQRSVIHFSQFTNGEGKRVNGVREDLLEIRKALIGHINKLPIAPKKVTSLAFDFIEGD